jgi:hypothetical protein
MDTNEADKTMEELALALARIYDGLGYEIDLSYRFTRTQIPTLRASERIRVVIVREHDEPQHPLYETPLFAGVPVMG